MDHGVFPSADEPRLEDAVDARLFVAIMAEAKDGKIFK
jgi:hypothetical protein